MNEQEINDIFTGYVEQNNFLTLADAGLYIYLKTTAKRGKKTPSLSEMAKLLDEDEERTIQRLDRLCDCMLIDENSYLHWITPQTKD